MRRVSQRPSRLRTADRTAKGLRRAAALAAVCMLTPVLTPVPADAAGAAYGMFYNSTSERYFLGEIDTFTGAATILGSGIAAKWISSGGSHMGADNTLGVGYVVAGPNDGASTLRSVYTVDLATGEQIEAHALVDAVSPVAGLGLNPYQVEYDIFTQTLYALVRIVPSGTFYVAVIDTTTGEVDVIGAGFTAFSIGSDSSLDWRDGLYHFTGKAASGETERIYTVSLATGAIVSNPLVSSGVAQLVLSADFVEYDHRRDQLLGLFGSNETSPRTRYLMRFDISSGAVTHLGDTFIEQIVYPGMATFDFEEGRFHALLRPSSPTDFLLYTLRVDGASGNLLANPQMTTVDAQLRNYPDFVAFAPEPGSLAAGAAAAAVLGLLATRRRRSPR